MARDREEHARLGRVNDTLLDRYRRDYEQSKRRSSGGADWIGLKDGLTIVRILPPFKESDPFYLLIGQHFNLGSSGKGNVYCPKVCLGPDGKTPMADWDCPICEYVDLVKRKSKKEKELEQAKEIGASVRWLCQALDRDEDDNKPRLWSFGPMIHNQVLEYITGKYPDLYDMEEGYDLNIKKSGKGLETKYQVYPEKDPTPVDEDVVKSMIDLEEYVRIRIFKPEELEKVLDGAEPMDIVNARTTEDKDERTRDRDSRRAPKDDRPARGRRDEPEPEDDPEPEPEEPEESPRGRGRREPEPAPAPRGRERESRREPEPAPRGRDRERGDKYDDEAQREMDRLRGESGSRRR